MPGYLLLNQKSLTPPLSAGRGVQANTRKIGFLDFIRELDDETFPYDENTSLMVMGLEDVLLAARPDMDTAAKDISRKLQHAAGKLISRACADIQIVFRGNLKRGENLIVENVTANLPIYLIFGSPADMEINGQKVFKRDFNLSSPT